MDTAAIFELKFFGITLAQLAIGVIGTVFVVAAVQFLARAVGTAVARAIKRLNPHLALTRQERFIMLARLALILLVFEGVKSALNLDKKISGYLDAAEKAFLVFAAVWLIFAITESFTDYIARRLQSRDKRLALTALPLLRRVFKVLVVIMALLFLLQNYGVNVSAIIAGLGIGGLAFALAAQKTVENLFGGVVLVLDQPLKVGDACRIGDITGAVEDIGIRSSRIRTPDRTLITIPNADLSQARIENLTNRDKFFMKARINLSLENNIDSLKSALAEINSMLGKHTEVESDNCQARLVDFGERFMIMELSAYIKTQSVQEFGSIRESVYLKTLSILEECGCQLNRDPTIGHIY